MVVVLLLLAVRLAIATPSMVVGEQVEQGGVLEILVWDSREIHRVEGAIQLGDRELSSGSGFAIPDPTGEGLSVFLILLDMSSTSRVGEAVATVWYRGADLLGERRFPVSVIEGEFLSEEIPLNRGMTSLRRDPSPVKTRQAIELRDITGAFNRDGVHLDEAFVLPVKRARRSSFFGDRREFVYDDNSRSRAIHNGIDFALPTGTPVWAPGSGRVVFSGNREVTGETVVIEHLPGLYSLYYHLDSRSVNEGEMLEQYNLIGTVGATGLVTGPHLHWEMRLNGTAISPDTIISSVRVDKAAITTKMAPINAKGR